MALFGLESLFVQPCQKLKMALIFEKKMIEKFRKNSSNLNLGKREKF